MGVEVEFLIEVPPGDPANRPCTILGKKKNLQCVLYSQVFPYLGDRVTEEVASLDY